MPACRHKFFMQIKHVSTCMQPTSRLAPSSPVLCSTSLRTSMPRSALRPIANLILGNQRSQLSSFNAWLRMDALEEATSRAECMHILCLRTEDNFFHRLHRPPDFGNRSWSEW